MEETTKRPLKVDLNHVLLDLDGNPVPDITKKAIIVDNKQVLPDLTLRSLFCGVLVSQKPDDVISGEEKAKRYNMAITMYPKDIVELDLDEATLLRDLVAEGYTPLVVGQVWNILDPPKDNLPDAEEAEEEPLENGVSMPDNTV